MSQKETKVVGAENVKLPGNSSCSPVDNSNQVVHSSVPVQDNSVQKVSTPALDPSTLDAINAAVMGAVKTIVDQLKPSSPSQASIQPQGASQYPTPYVPPHQPYRSKLQGIPVQIGQDLRHVHPMVIRDWFAGIQARAIQRLAQQGRKAGIETQMTIDSGTPMSVPVRG